MTALETKYLRRPRSTSARQAIKEEWRRIITDARVNAFRRILDSTQQVSLQDFWLIADAVRAAYSRLSLPAQECLPTKMADLAVSGSRQRDRQSIAAELNRKIVEEEFDVFLCYNAVDRRPIRRIRDALVGHGILPWLDESELRPGATWQKALAKQITRVKSAAVFVGPKGLGPWQDLEVEALLREFVRRKRTVIPVVLRGCRRTPRVPLFLRGFTWVDFRKSQPDPMEQLLWGITGRRRSVTAPAAAAD